MRLYSGILTFGYNSRKTCSGLVYLVHWYVVVFHHRFLSQSTVMLNHLSPRNIPFSSTHIMNIIMFIHWKKDRSKGGAIGIGQPALPPRARRSGEHCKLSQWGPGHEADQILPPAIHTLRVKETVHTKYTPKANEIWQWFVHRRCVVSDMNSSIELIYLVQIFSV